MRTVFGHPVHLIDPISRRPLVAAKAALAITLLTAGVAFGADRVASHSTPRGQAAPAGFRISGTLAGPLSPGISQPLALTLTNRHRWSIDVKRLSVAITVDRAHEQAGCFRVTHFRQTAIPSRTFPLRLPPKSTRTLRQLGVRTPPRVLMRNLAYDQRACAGATLRLRFAGLSRRAGRALAG